MDGLTEKEYAIAWFIKHSLENTFREMDMESVLQKAEDAKVEFTFENDSISNDTAITLTPKQTSILNLGLLNLAVKLPPFLYNAGFTCTVISSNKVHIKLHNNFLGITVEDVGVFIVDIKGNKFHARIWQTVDTYDKPVNEKPIEINEVFIMGNTHKRNLNTDFNYAAAIHRDKDYIIKQLKSFLNKEGIPTSVNDLIPGIGIKIDWLKHKELVRKLGPLHEVYKGLLKTPAYKGIINNSPMGAVYDIGTAKQGEGNLPGIDAIPGGKQLVDIMANDPLRKDDLLFIDVAQKTSASKTDDWGNSQGGYGRLINTLRTYNDNNWGDNFQGVYLHEEELKMIEKIKFIIPKAMHFTTSFMQQPYDQNRNPYEFFMYIRSDQLNSEYLKLDEVGVIYVNPAKQ